jgi:toxin YoeB
MGKFKVIVSDKAKRDLLEIQRSGDKASIKKVEQIISELYIQEPENLND